MTITSSDFRNAYTGNGSTTVFAYTFKIDDANHLKVTLVSTAGVETVTTAYTVSGVGLDAGGNVTMTTAPASGVKIVITRNQPFQQNTDYVTGAAFSADTHESALDELTMNDIQQNEVLTRAVKAPVQDGAIAELPNITNRKNKILTFDANGDPETSVLTADIANLINNLSVGTSISGYSTVTEFHLGSEFDGANKITLSQSYTPGNNNLFVFRNGQLLRRGSSYDYTETSSTEVTLTYNPNDSDTFLFVIGVLSSAGSIDASNVTYTPAGAGAVSTNVQTALRGITNYGPRDRITYKDATSVYIHSAQFPMGGFRFHGSYKKSQVKSFPASATPISCSTSSDLAFGMSSVVLENWYAVFACANDGDANATLKIVPFLRADSVATSVVTLRKAGENVHSSSPQTYTWAAGALDGLECLVISETVDGRANAFSGRVATITASTATNITLDTIGTVAVNDWLLPAPNGFDNYRYCGAFYVDTAEVRNIADSGSYVASRGIFDQSGTNTGSIAAPGELRNISGYISPLATAVMLHSYCIINTAAVGSFVENFALDGSNHDVATHYVTKVDTSDDIRTFLKSGRLVSGFPDIAISTNFDVVCQNAVVVSINTTLYQVSAATVCDTGTSSTFPAGTWGVFCVYSDTSGTLTATWDTNSGAGYASEALAAAARPGLETNKAAIAYVTVQANAGASFTAGTDALTGGTGGNPAQTTNYYNSSDAANVLGDSDVEPVNSGQLFIPFSFGQQYYYWNGGTLAASRTSGQQNIYGWIEP